VVATHEEGKDPRRFSFAIICKLCRFSCATFQEMRLQVTQKCTSRPRRVDLYCEHCGKETTDWPDMVEHLNEKGIQYYSQPTCVSARICFPVDVLPDMTHYTSQSETLRYQTKLKGTHRPRTYRPQDILATAVCAAGISATTTNIAISTSQLTEAVVVPFLEGDVLKGGESDAVEESQPVRNETLPRRLPHQTYLV